MSEIISPLVSVIAAMIGIATLIINRRESRAKVENLEATTGKTKVEIKINTQEQINKLMDKNNELFDRLLLEREQTEKAQNRISKDLKTLETNLQMTNQSLVTEQTRALNLENEVIKYKNSYLDQVVIIEELRKQTEDHAASIDRIKTGQLPEREELHKV